jgi:hypothetical protein
MSGSASLATTAVVFSAIEIDAVSPAPSDAIVGVLFWNEKICPRMSNPLVPPSNEYHVTTNRPSARPVIDGRN